ncbi:NADPH-dependent FMN reductase [Paractinoplanes brasiliensis]|uniref:NAD(P)H-dependent FMN reductase n=1 Tax=Paractinoplanes brasiliensis TaxID=52695 RepID=A0A4R6J770_9ACTN|nr:NAD(P)H-dependent oxidoreductase [Actinoplanes brasiliensis]TDO31373.1 NAD(P)H-dependent FMN reductase [Actinoplanes brasiliensis]GID28295.1 FMN reductase [Actinoplanes brasiliensis]
MSELNLLVVIGSTRPGRIGPTVAEWFVDAAKAHGGFQVTVADLAEEALPLLDEPHHPRLRNYQNEHTKRWSEKVAAADAIVFVIPEYNYGLGAAFKNALDYLHAEWSYKPASVVSYGGVSAGTRSAMALTGAAYALRLFLIPAAVNIPFVHSLVHDGQFQPTDVTTAAATTMLDELARVAPAMRTLRTS